MCKHSFQHVCVCVCVCVILAIPIIPEMTVEEWIGWMEDKKRQGMTTEQQMEYEKRKKLWVEREKEREERRKMEEEEKIKKTREKMARDYM